MKEKGERGEEVSGGEWRWRGSEDSAARERKRGREEAI
jgi:hypothetical protein